MLTMVERGRTYVLANVTCLNLACVNYNVPLSLWVPVTGSIIGCGPCDTDIDTGAFWDQVAAEFPAS